jgi:cytochrome c-type biogenesis protein
VTALGGIGFVALPIGLGLFGFVEPCTIGSSLLFIKHIEGRDPGGKLAEVGLFAVTRTVLLGALGAAAVALGTNFIGFQRAAWIALGAIYMVLGALYAAGRARALMVEAGPARSRLAGLGGAAGLGLLFGLNVPACAMPLLIALFGAAAAEGAAGGSFLRGFVLLGLFGFALSLPLIVAVLVPGARRALDWIAGLARRAPFWTGIVLIGLGLWSIGFGLFARLGGPV